MARSVLSCCFVFAPLAAAFPCSAQTAPAPQAPSSLVQPALASVAHAGSAVDLNKWKGPNAAREEVDANLGSIQQDLQTTLPPLLAAADAAPSSPSATLPVLLNLDALYSVLLRVTIASRTGAPRDENVALEQSATVLDGARRDLGNAIVAAAKAQEQRITELQATVKQQQASLASAAAAASTPAPSSGGTSKSRRKKPAASTQSSQ